MIIDGLSWHQFSSLPHIAQLPLNRQLIEYEIYNQNLIHEVFLTQQLYNQEVVVPSSAGSAAAPIVEEEGLPSNCIAFVNNTINGTYSEISITTSGPTSFTVEWGDGTIFTDVVDGSYTVDYTYVDSDQSYNCTLCFDDISLVTELDFTGDD